MSVSDEEYLKKMQEVVYTEQATEIFSLIYNYKVKLETQNKTTELEKVVELEEYLRNNEKGLIRYQYKLGYKEEELLQLEKNLKNCKYKHGKYTKFKIYQPKERIIMASESIDRIMHH